MPKTLAPRLSSASKLGTKHTRQSPASAAAEYRPSSRRAYKSTGRAYHTLHSLLAPPFLSHAYLPTLATSQRFDSLTPWHKAHPAAPCQCRSRVAPSPPSPSDSSSTRQVAKAPPAAPASAVPSLAPASVERPTALLPSHYSTPLLDHQRNESKRSSPAFGEAPGIPSILHPLPPPPATPPLPLDEGLSLFSAPCVCVRSQTRPQSHVVELESPPVSSTTY